MPSDQGLENAVWSVAREIGNIAKALEHMNRILVVNAWASYKAAGGVQSLEDLAKQMVKLETLMVEAFKNA